MSKLNVSKASGPDCISYRLLKECAFSLAEPFCRLFEKSFMDGIFPSKWKISNIAPVFKKAFRHIKENYRPVSLLSCISKIMERIVFNTMYEYFKINGLLTERNSGFKEKDSTINQLIHLCHNIYKGLDNSRDVCLVFLDVSKAFDKVYHPALLQKLENMGIRGNLLRWIKSYLSDRKQRVVINGVESDLRDINASVPQGSILGPLLFLCHVNDIVDNLETLPYLFADDTSLYCEIDPTDVPGTFDMINRDLVRLSTWANTWRVQFNATKTVYMIVSNKKQAPNYPNLYLHGQVLHRVNEHKHLGITLSSKMKWDSYVEQITIKAASRLNGIKRISHIITRRAKITLYQTLVLPVLEYGSVLYDNCTTILKNRVEQIQRKAAIICTGAFRITSYTRLLEELGWNSLDDRRSMARRLMLYKMNHDLVPPYLSALLPPTVYSRVGNYVLRNAGDFTLVKTKKAQFYQSFLPKTIREWNNSVSAWRGLDFAPSVDSFKSGYRKLLHRSPNKFFNIELENGNIQHSRLRMGLSHLRAHLFHYNLIDNPDCQFCNIEPETTGHYVLRCPSFHAARTNYLLGLIANLEMDYVNNLRLNPIAGMKVPPP